MTRHSSIYGCYEIESIPGQPQIAHCHSFFVPIDRRGLKLSHALKEHQVKTLAAELYDYATATVDASNEAQKRVLEKAGFRLLDAFSNSKTGGTTELWGRQITRG